MDATFQSNSGPMAPEDAYLWLEEIQSRRVQDWLIEQNAASHAALKAHPDFKNSKQRIQKILDSPDQIPYGYRQGDFFINFWQDENNPRGLWRRTSLAEYRNSSPHWETMLDLDSLAQAESENWVWAGADCLGGKSTRCLISLSRGGTDAVVVREFDTATKQFVAKGFHLPEAKSTVTWLDEDRVFVSTNFGPGSLTESGYPRLVKLWRRGQTLNEARVVFEGKASDVAVNAEVDHTPGFKRITFERTDSFYTSQLYLWHEGQEPEQVHKPDDAKFSFWRERVLIELRSDWTVEQTNGMVTWPSGSLLVGAAKAYLEGKIELTALFKPTPSNSLADFTVTRNHVLLCVLEHVVGHAEAWYFEGGSWCKRDIVTPGLGTLSLSTVHDPQVSNDTWGEYFLLNYSDFLTPDSLYLCKTDHGEFKRIKSSPAFFEATNIKAEQRFAISQDGTRVPYFVVGAENRLNHGPSPTLLYGYGGFEASEHPRYTPDYGSEWLAKGGVLVVANIRGGGEYGPAWHQAAVTSNKQKSYDDFVAVAEDLIARNTTTPRHLGIQGASNGGLLVAAVMIQRPELFGAVLCQVPLLDMRRYHTLLAGASWMAEYGDPDNPEDWATISKYSPYHNVHAGVTYPPVFFVTSTLDDRVHPAHARKMAAKMTEQGHRVLYHEHTEGGHNTSADNAQTADRIAMEFAFLWQHLDKNTKPDHNRVSTTM